MNKNYYEILQVDKNASFEIIEKAYKTLVKKYHPDLQEENEKNKSEKILKEINEAYDVLSNSEKRKNYDNFLNNTFISKEKFDELYNENKILKSKLYEMQEKNQNTYFQNSSHTNFQNFSKNNFSYKKDLKEYLKFLFALSITLLFFFFMIKVIFF